VVIGTGAVVAADVPSYAIVAGNPAKVVRYRFADIEIEKLLALRWWEWNIDKIKANISKLCSAEIETIIKDESK
jgi:acyl-[acyl carrier protein]--UDP-N-acetylglucosamine O-acyltransferase